MANKMIEFLIESGAEITGSSVGAIIGGIIGGPTGAAIGITGGKAVEIAFSKLGSEINEKVLSKRESKKIGATATYALSKIKENIEKGEQLRDDGFFDEDFSDRSKADEVLEGVMFLAQRENEEKKLRHYGYLIANLAFREEIGVDDANHLITLMNNISYRQLKLLALFCKRDRYFRSTRKIENPLYRNDEIVYHGITYISVFQDILHLYQYGLIRGYKMGLQEDIMIDTINVNTMSFYIYSLMELSTIPKEDLRELEVILGYTQ